VAYERGASTAARTNAAFRSLQDNYIRLQREAETHRREAQQLRKTLTKLTARNGGGHYIPHPGKGDFGPEAARWEAEQALAWAERHYPEDELTGRRRLQEATDEALGKRETAAA
jgi:hypothetical protein